MSINAISTNIPQRLPTGQTNGLTVQKPGVTGGLSGQLPQSNVVNNLNNLNGINQPNGSNGMKGVSNITALNGLNGSNSLSGINPLNGSNGLSGASTSNGLSPVNNATGGAEAGLTPSPAELFRILMASLLNSLAQGTSGSQSSNIFNSSLNGGGDPASMANCEPGTEAGTGTGTGSSTPQTAGLKPLGATDPNALSNPSTPSIPAISPTNPTTFNPFTQARIA